MLYLIPASLHWTDNDKDQSEGTLSFWQFGWPIRGNIDTDRLTDWLTQAKTRTVRKERTCQYSSKSNPSLKWKTLFLSRFEIHKNWILSFKVIFHPLTLLSENCSVCIFPYYLLKHFTGNFFRHEIESNPREKTASLYAHLRLLKYIYIINETDRYSLYQLFNVYYSVGRYYVMYDDVECICNVHSITVSIVCWLWGGRGSICLVSWLGRHSGE